LTWAAIHLKWDSWLFAAAASIAAYLLVTLPYRRAAAKAEDSYFRHAGLGKYVGTRGAPDA
jgi:hypothetical protein